MKKFIILLIVLFMFGTLFPAAFLAEGTAVPVPEENITNTEESPTEEPSTDEHIEDSHGAEAPIAEAPAIDAPFNELGIQEGTMIHGEDISELTEEELQYVPEGWRDGIVEEGEHEHPEEPSQKASAANTLAAYPKVNSYIASKNFYTAKVETDHKGIFPKMQYRYGTPEGVVAHETANDYSTITGEISYMTGNYNNAFVHAFVDHSRIIEIHPTDNSVWGAGRYGNARFIQVELVRSSTYDAFARSINNYSDYIAMVLHKYNLGVTNGDYNGNGSLWSHRAVSNFLGGTTHVDPHGYFAKYGYTWNEFIALVTQKYNKYVTTASTGVEQPTSRLGHISYSTKIYKDYKNPSLYSFAGTARNQNVYYVKKKVTYNNVLYYLISTQSSSVYGVVGWVKASEMNSAEHVKVDGLAKTFYVNGTGKSYTDAWGSSNNVVNSSLAAQQGDLFAVHLTERVGTAIWYRGVLGGKTVWLSEKDVTKGSEVPTSRLGHISYTTKIYKDYSNLGGFIQAGTSNNQNVYYVKKQVNYNGELFLLISLKPSSTTGVIGWVKASEMNDKEHVKVDGVAKTFFVKGTGKSFTDAWGSSRNVIHSSMASMQGQAFNVHLTERVGTAIWYRGTIGGQTVWMSENDVTLGSETATSRLGHISQSTKIFQDYAKTGNYKLAGSTYNGNVYYVKKQAVYKNVQYLLISTRSSSTSGVIGWVKASEMNDKEHVKVDGYAKTFYVSGTGKSFTDAWGSRNNVVHSSLYGYKGNTFSVHLTERVGTDIWYRGVLAGNTVWIHSSLVKTNR